MHSIMSSSATLWDAAMDSLILRDLSWIDSLGPGAYTESMPTYTLASGSSAQHFGGIVMSGARGDCWRSELL